jgi:hypothetical protein
MEGFNDEEAGCLFAVEEGGAGGGDRDEGFAGGHFGGEFEGYLRDGVCIIDVAAVADDLEDDPFIVRLLIETPEYVVLELRS